MERTAGDRRETFFDQRFLAINESRSFRAICLRATRDRCDIGLVVLTEVRGIGEGNGALRAHPRDRYRGVETTREGDADALANGQGCEDFGHGLSVTAWFTR